MSTLKTAAGFFFAWLTHEVHISTGTGGAVITTLTSLALQQCVDECSRRNADCISIEYFRGLGQCHLYRQATLTQQTNISGDIVSMNVSGPIRSAEMSACKIHSCRSGTVCREKNGSHQCVHEECPTISLPPGRTLRVRGNQNSIGKKVSLSCPAGYKLHGASSVICQANGTWSATPSDSFCVPDCGPVPTVPHGRITKEWNDTTLNLVHVIYSCDNGYMMWGSQQVTCPRYGSWSASPVCSTRKTCKLTSECLYPNSECRDGACWCKLGFSHSPCMSACVSSCETYGSTYQTFEGKAITDHNEDEENGLSFGECLEMCERATRYQCVTFDYTKILFYTICNTQSVSALAYLSDFESYPGTDHHHRDCVC